jgi:hyperosmotically inducible periplasmic protein
MDENRLQMAIAEKGELMKRIALLMTAALLCQCGAWAGEISTFRSYVDSDLCARLMLGPIVPERTDCSQKTVKDGAEPVLVRLSNNMVFAVNKQKMIKPLVGQLAEVSGEIKVKAGTMKLEDAKAIDAAAIPAGDPERRLLGESRQTEANPQLREKIRHELAMMPYITEFDFISFVLLGNEVILTGWTVRQTNRDYAQNVVKVLPGVETVVNNIEILPLGSFDMQIRAGVRAALQRHLSRYFWGSGSDIKIVVKNGQVTLLGTVSSKADSDLAYMQANSVPNAFKVFNLLRVATPAKKGALSAAPEQAGRQGD